MADRVPRTYTCRVGEIDRLRLERGWSLEQLARRAGIHARTMRRIMDGEQSYIRTINLLAAKLGVSATALIDARLGAPPQEKPARFKFHLQLQGRFRSEEQKIHLIRLTPDILRSLGQEGITVTGQKSTVVTSRLSSGLDQWRFLIGFVAMTDDRPSWGLAAVIPSRLPPFLKVRSFSTEGFAFGEIVEIGWGGTVDGAALRRAAHIYGCRPSDVMDLSVRRLRKPPKSERHAAS